MLKLESEKIKELINKKVEEVIQEVEFILEETEEYDKLTDELYELEQSSVAFYKLTIGEATKLSSEDVFTCRKYLEISEQIQRIGWKLMYIQGIKDSFSILEELIKS